MNVKTNHHLAWAAIAAMLLGSACFTTGVAAQAGPQQGIGHWVSWGKAAGEQHAADLAKRNLETNYANCDIRASLELASKVKLVNDQQHTAFMDAFESTCVDAASKSAALEAEGQLAGQSAAAPARR